MIRRTARLAALLLCAGAAAPAAACALPLLSHHGRWLTDPHGRVVILHGLQIDKFRPTEPVEHLDLSPANVRFLGAQGFNLARVSMAYQGFEPSLGDFRNRYVRSYRRFDRGLARAGVYNLLDMMQGVYGPAVGGAGFPPWMTLTGGAPNNHEPYPNGYVVNPAENAAWDSLWRNAPAADGVGLQDHYAAGLHRIAATLRRDPAFLGIDVLNEPWPGSPWPTCANPLGCPPGGFDQRQFTDFYRRIVPAIRSADPRHLVFYEPNLLFDFGAQTGLGAVGDRQVVLAFHNYCLATVGLGFTFPDPFGDCSIDERLVFDNAEAYAERTGAGLLMDEWGNSTDTKLVDRVADEADQHMVGWSEWSYEDCCQSPAAVIADGTKPPTAPGNLRIRMLQALVRAYPQAIAGTPTAWSYDPGSRVFHLAYLSRPLVPGKRPARVTRIEVPPLHYPTGYGVSARGARVISAPDADPLLVRNREEARAVDVTVRPAANRPAPAGIPMKCRLRSRRLGLHAQGHGRVSRATISVDGQLVASRSGTHLHWVRVPGGLSEGSIVRSVATTSRHLRVVTVRRVERCRLSSPRSRIRRTHGWYR